jgi:CheY-like chemotaxis protein
MGKRRQRRDAERAAEASALAEEAMVVWRVLSWYRQGAQPVYGAPLRCPDCGALSLVLRVDRREGLARNRCTECDHEFLVSERAMDAVLSGTMTRPSGVLFPGELVPPEDSTNPGTTGPEPVTTDPDMADSGTTDPDMADSGTTDPGMADSGTTDPVTVPSPATPHAPSPVSPVPPPDPPMASESEPVDAVADAADGRREFGPVIVTDGDGTSRTVHPGSAPAFATPVPAPPSTPPTTTPEPATSAGPPATSTSLFSAPRPTPPDDERSDTLAGADPVATPPLRVLLVEDDPGDAALIEAVLARPGPERFEVRVASSRRDGEELAQAFVPDVVLLDLDLPDSHGLATITRWCFSGLPGTVIVMSSDHDEQIEAQGLEHGVAEFLPKAQITALVDADDAAVEQVLAVLTTERDAIH